MKKYYFLLTHLVDYQRIKKRGASVLTLFSSFSG